MRERLTNLFRKEFKDTSLVLSDHTTAKDIKGWDSLKHVSLIVAIEKEFGISFTAREVLSVKKHIDLENIISQKLKS
jgi:acyl carrier protein